MSPTSLSPSELFVNKTTYYFFQGSLVGTHKSDAFLYESYDLTFHLKYVSLQCVQVCDPPIECLRIELICIAYLMMPIWRPQIGSQVR